jgi:hypothetical protein
MVNARAWSGALAFDVRRVVEGDYELKNWNESAAANRNILAGRRESVCGRRYFGNCN